MHTNKLEQNDVVSILMNTVKQRNISTMTGQLVGWESVMLNLLRCTLEMVTIEWNAKSTPSPTSISHTLFDHKRVEGTFVSNPAVTIRGN